MRHLTIAQLAERCHADQLGRKSNSKHCRELFHLALAQGDQQAWAAVHNEFHPMVEGWVYTYSRFWQTDEEVAFFANAAFTRLWRGGSGHAAAGKFQKLSQYLQFLKRCTWSAIEDHLRKSKRDALWEAAGLNLQNPDVAVEQQPVMEQLFEALWEITKDDERERLTAEESWVYGLPPREIQAEYPRIFKTPGEVSQIKRNILKRLGRNPKIKVILELLPNNSGRNRMQINADKR